MPLTPLKVMPIWTLCLAMPLLIFMDAEAASQTQVSVMSYNLENLFDWQHDEGKNDLTYLPIMQKQNPAHRYVCGQIKRQKWRDQCLNFDWNEQAARQKMLNLAKVVLSVNRGQGPDVLILQEIENKTILDLFNREYLAKARYQTSVLREGRDRRGIDVALLSRFPLKSEGKLHYIPFKSISKEKADDTRPILEAPLRLPNGTALHVFGVHFPAPYHPWELRQESFSFLNKLVTDLPESAIAMAGGDFNVPADEEKIQKLFKGTAQTKWDVAFYKGCKDCKGTYYYPPLKQWSFLDSLLLRKNTKAGWSFHAPSIRVIQNSFQLDATGFPKSFDLKTQAGASDHLPIYAEIHGGGRG